MGEAVSLVQILLKDPTSWLHAAQAEWKHPVEREFFVLADLFDAFAKVNFKRPTPYPRPTPEKSKAVEQLGERIDPLSLADVLRAFGRDVPTGLDHPAEPANSPGDAATS